jgi:Fe-S-cluster containining protein
MFNWFKKLLGHRCSGNCCKDFYLPISPKELWLSYKKFKGEIEDDKVTIIQDIEIIYPMVKFLRIDERGNHKYSCKHLKRGNCSIYKTRPKMCRDYPYGKACIIPGYTWVSVGGMTRLFKLVYGCKKQQEMIDQYLKTEEAQRTINNYKGYKK